MLLGGLIIGFVAALSLLAILELNAVQAKQAQRLLQAEQFDDATQHILTANVQFKKQVQRWKNILIRGNDPADFMKEKVSFSQQEKLVQLALKAAAQVRHESNSAQQEINALIEQHQALSERYKTILAQFDPSDPMTGQKIDDQIRGIDSALAEALQNKVDALAVSDRKQRKDNDWQTQQDLQHAKSVILLASMICVLGLVSLLYFILRRVLRQIGADPTDVIRIADEVAEGNLTVPIKTSAQGSVLYHFNEMVLGLSSLVDNVQQACDELNNIAKVVNAAAEQLSNNSVEQAKFVAINRTALEQIAVTVEKNDRLSKQLALMIDTTDQAADFIEEIHFASKEQAAAIIENRKHLQQLANKADNNAQHVLKLATTVRRLQGQAEQLSQLINVFKTV
jgi:methyl-accepting chemotaxis protein